jgi:hypothetical protein
MDANAQQEHDPANEKDSPTAPKWVEMPAPTAWPFVTAVGVTLLAAGLLTNVAFTIVGAVVFVAALYGWARQLMPGIGYIHEPVLQPEHWAPPVRPATVGVEPRAEHARGERVRLPEWIHPYSSGLKGGIVGGILMALAALGYGLVTNRGIWYPVNLLAAMLLPSLAHATLHQLIQFSLAGLLVGIVIHAVASLSVGLLLAVLWPTLPRPSLLWGGIAVPLMWTGVIYSLMGVLNPTMGKLVDWPWFIVSQIAFGVGAGHTIIRTQVVPASRSQPSRSPGHDRSPSSGGGRG